MGRFDVASAKATLTAAEFRCWAARAERLPEISFNASYGGGGANPASYNRVDEVRGSVSLPLFTSGRIRSDIHAAESDLVQRRAELADIEGRADYDVRTARLDAQASESGVKVADENRNSGSARSCPIAGPLQERSHQLPRSARSPRGSGSRG